jgi:hypothetical protein
MLLELLVTKGSASNVRTRGEKCWPLVSLLSLEDEPQTTWLRMVGQIPGFSRAKCKQLNSSLMKVSALQGTAIHHVLPKCRVLLFVISLSRPHTSDGR